MKVLILIAAFVMVNSGEWLTNFDQAQQEAKSDHKMILLNFSGSDWCAPCIQMKHDVFEQTTFQEYASKNLVLVRADFPRNKKHQLDAAQKAHNEQLAEKYNPQGKFPLTLLLDADGKVIHAWDGFNNQTVTDFIKQVDQHVHGK